MGKVRIVIKHNPHKLHKAHDPITVDIIYSISYRSILAFCSYEEIKDNISSEAA